MRWFWVGLWLIVVIAWFHQNLPQGYILGLPASDVGRALWGWNHQATSLPFPVSSDDIAFPDGAKLVVLPFVSTILGAPFRWLLGPIVGFNAWMLTLHWVSGLCVALLAREVTRSETAGWIAGTAMVVQPMQLLHLMDATAEYVALWSMPLTLLFLHAAKRTDDRRYALAAGAMGTVVALDSPYYAIFTILFVPMVLSWKPKTIGWSALSAGVGLLIIFLLYYGIKVQPKPSARGENCAGLDWWWQAEWGNLDYFPWVHGELPTFIPLLSLAVATILALFRPRQALLWWGAGLLALLLSLGPQDVNTRTLISLFSGPGRTIGELITSFNDAIHVPVIRFPRRWLVAAALGFFMAAELGLARIASARVRLGVGIAVAVLLVGLSDRLLPYRTHPPGFSAPRPAFATFVAERPEPGAILMLPNQRVMPRQQPGANLRFNLPVFASISSDLASYDELWIQVLTGRPSVNYPNLDVLAARPRDPALTAALGNITELTWPVAIHEPVPKGYYMQAEPRAAAFARLIAAGLRFVLVDDASFDATATLMLREIFTPHIREEHRFTDGTGVTVWVVGP